MSMLKNDLTTGPVRRHLIRMAVFMLVTMMVQTAYSLIDMYWVGRLGREAIAAVSIGSNLMILVLALTQILAVGTVSLVSQAAGRKDSEAVGTLFNQALIAALSLGGTFGAVMWLLRQLYCDAQAGDAQTATLAMEFLRWFIPALVLQFPMMAMGSALRGLGDMRTVAAAQGGTILLNILLAPFLIFGWGTGIALGVAGASLATLLAMIVGVLVMITHIHRKGIHFAVGAGAWRPRFKVWRRIATIGLPSGAEFGVMALYFGFVIAIIRPFGPAAQAAFGIGMRVLQVGMLPAMSIAFAGSAIAGQNFGAKMPARVRENYRLSTITAVGLGIVLALLFQIAPRQLATPFSSDPAVLDYCADFLRMISWNLIALGFIFPCFSVFSAFGNTSPSLLGSAVRIGFIVIVTGWLSQRPDFRIHWIWVLSVIGTLFQMSINLWFLRRGFSRHLAPLERTAEPFAA